MSNDKLFWGDSHTNLHLGRPESGSRAQLSHTNLPQEHLGDLEKSLAHARQVLDFWPIAYYPYAYAEHEGFRVETWGPEDRVDAAWAGVCDLARRHSRDGELVVFPGYEWQGDATHGDHNVFFHEDHPPILRSGTLPELYGEIRQRKLKAMVIPHHTAYQVGFRAKDWSVHDEELSPFAEVFSWHGSSETDEEAIGLRRNWYMGPGVSGGTIADGLDRGLRLGLIASGDSHYNTPGVYGWGLMACYAPSLTRDALWEAFGARHVYAVTGDRIELRFSAEGAQMGDVIEKRGGVHLSVRVRGCDALDRIELLRNNRVIATHCHQGTWEPPTGGERIRCKLRVEAGWGAKTVDEPDLPSRQWRCAIEVPDGAVVGAEPCWKTPGQRIGAVGGSRCEFGFLTATQDVPHGGVPSEATLFELEGRPEDTVRLELDGKRLDMTLSEAMAASRIVSYSDEAAQRARAACGIDPDSLTRKDRLYFYGHKAKIHRAIPEQGFSGSLDHVDESPPAGRNHYRVRVTQRNGQAAWSSPIWADNR